MADHKTWMDFWFVMAPTTLASGVGLLTAISITNRVENRKIQAQKLTEQAKIDSQVALEKQRLEFQEALETERMAFQRESELQKQHMELYKTLFTERLNASKELSRLCFAAYDPIVTSFETWTDDQREEVKVKYHEAAMFRNANGWLFHNAVNESATAFHGKVHDCLGGGTRETRSQLIDDMGDSLRELGTAIDAMMRTNDIASLIIDPLPLTSPASTTTPHTPPDSARPACPTNPPTTG